MILQALVKYYESLLHDGMLPRPGWGEAKVSFALHLSETGELLGLIPLKQNEIRGKKEVLVPQVLIVPEPKKRSVGIAPQFLCDNSSYILGIDDKGKPERTRQCFEAAVKEHQDLLADCQSTAAEAVKSFFQNWKPEQAREHEALKPYLDELGSANFVFFVDGNYAHRDSEIVAAWNKGQMQNNDGIVMQCLVTGEKAPVARLHPSIKGVKGAQSSGASLVSFNAPSYESYGRNKDQGLNAPVSQYAAFAYGTALNYLLADANHVKVLGDTTVVYWAGKQSDIYQDFFGGWGFGDNRTMDDNDLNRFFEAVQSDQGIEYQGIQLEYDNPFYVLGLAPNAARLSVRFFMRSTFGDIVQNIAAHMKRMEIIKPSFEEFSHISIWRMLQETVSKNAKVKMASPLMAGAVMQAILGDTKYPVSLFQNVMLRIRAEEGSGKINYRRAAIIKAYLEKNVFAGKGRQITVALNTDSTNTAYVLGRTFSVLEQIQQTANPGINATIKDRYFDSACATPAPVFSLLLKLANHHLRKLEVGQKIYFNKQLTELMGKIEMDSRPLPRYLALEDQGIFVLGYYHQNQKRYEKKEEK